MTPDSSIRSKRRFAVSGAPALEVSTFDGSVDVSTWDRPEVLVVIEKHVAGDLRVRTGDGRVEVRDVPFSGDSDRADPGTARGRLGSGGPTVSIRSGDGVITIRRSAGAS